MRRVGAQRELVKRQRQLREQRITQIKRQQRRWALRHPLRIGYSPRLAAEAMAE
jgi:hypothetical protein